jgi:hypothetical protein
MTAPIRFCLSALIRSSFSVSFGTVMRPLLTIVRKFLVQTLGTKQTNKKAFSPFFTIESLFTNRVKKPKIFFTFGTVNASVNAWLTPPTFLM